MRSGLSFAAVLLASLVFLTAPAAAQLLNPQAEPRQDFEIRAMNFDLWCQQTMRYPVERCSQRLEADLREFEAHRTIIEREETQFLLEQRRDAEALKQVERDYGAPWSDYSDPLGR